MEHQSGDRDFTSAWMTVGSDVSLALSRGGSSLEGNIASIGQPDPQGYTRTTMEFDRPRDTHTPASGPLVVLVGLDPRDPALWSEFRTAEATKAEELGELNWDDVAVLVIGPGVNEDEARHLLAFHADGRPPRNIVVGYEGREGFLQDLVDKDLVFYVSRAVLPDAHLVRLVTRAAEQWRRERSSPSVPQLLTGSAVRLERLMSLVRELALQTDMKSALRLLARGTEDVIGADRVECVIYDPERDALWAEYEQTDDALADSAAAGIIAYVCRTGEPVRLERVSTDARYDAECDNPDGASNERFIAFPVTDLQGGAAAVLVARRRVDSPAFTESDEEQLRELVEYATAAIGHIILSSRLGQMHRTSRSAVELFRQEAIESRWADPATEGGLTPAPPMWLTKTHRGFALAALLALIALWFGQIDEYAAGPAVVRLRNRIVVNSPRSGIVRSVEALPADHVPAGHLLVRLHDSLGLALAERLMNEVRAPVTGMVSDVRVRSGQPVNPGDVLVSMIDGDPEYDVIGFIPSRYLPRLAAGLQLNFRLDGYEDFRDALRIETVSEAVAPLEAAKSLEIDTSDALAGKGAVVLARARVRRVRFASGGSLFRYNHGLSGQAEIRIGSQPVLYAIAPGLKPILEGWLR